MKRFLNSKNPCETSTFGGGASYKPLQPKLSSTLILDNKTLSAPTEFERRRSSKYLKNVKKVAFTLAEVLITLTILGVIAAITVPTLISKQNESANRVKLRKAMAVYEKALNDIAVIHNAKTIQAIQDVFGADCANVKQFFKTEGNGCQFKTSDGVWWDITDPKKVIVAFKQEDLTDENASDFNNKKAFYLVYSIDDGGIIRINDLGYETEQESDNRNALIKLYNTTNKMEGQEIVNLSPMDKWKNGDYDTPCTNNLTACTQTIDGYGESKKVYDENGRVILDYGFENLEGFENYLQVEYIYDNDSDTTTPKVKVTYKDGTTEILDTLEISNTGTTNNDGYSCSISYNPNWRDDVKGYYYTCACIAAGTQITLADGTTKNVEDITFEDELRVWDFDNGCMASSKPLFIKKPEIAEQYNLLTFSDGRTLKTINQHRIFNKEAGKYTYPMTDDTPIGTTTLLDDGTEVTLVDKKYVYEPVEYYNIITNYHMNCFASGISTSCRLNNLYPIKDYKFVKEERELTPYEDFHGIPREWYNGLRLAEQSFDINRDGADRHDKSLNDYVTRLIRTNDESKHLALV